MLLVNIRSVPAGPSSSIVPDSVAATAVVIPAGIADITAIDIDFIDSTGTTALSLVADDLDGSSDWEIAPTSVVPSYVSSAGWTVIRNIPANIPLAGGGRVYISMKEFDGNTAISFDSFADAGGSNGNMDHPATSWANGTIAFDNAVALTVGIDQSKRSYAGLDGAADTSDLAKTLTGIASADVKEMFMLGGEMRTSDKHEFMKIAKADLTQTANGWVYDTDAPWDRLTFNSGLSGGYTFFMRSQESGGEFMFQANSSHFGRSDGYSGWGSVNVIYDL